MRRLTLVFGSLALLCLGCSGGSSGGSSSSASSGSASGSTGGSGSSGTSGSTGGHGSIASSSGSSGSSSGSSGSTGTGYVRLAVTVPDLPFNFDVCVRDSSNPSAPFIGPFFHSVGGSGITYGQVSRYAPLPVTQSGYYDGRLVAAGSSDCSQPLIGTQDITQLLSLADGEYATAVVVGSAFGSDPTFALNTLQIDDETMVTDPSMTSLRWFNAVVDSHWNPATMTLPADGGPTAPLAFSESSYTDPATDLLGYLEVPPVTGGELTLTGVDGGPITATGYDFAAGELHTIFWVGGAGQPVQLLTCLDTADLFAPDGGFFLSCSLKP